MCSLLSRIVQPDRIYQSIDRIDFSRLFTEGKRLILLDIDNTLIHHGGGQSDAFSQAIVAQIRKSGLMPFIISNARPSRARKFADSLSVDFIGLSGKPSPKGLLNACAKTGYKTEQAVMIGDQLFTDVLAARRAKVMAILVLPLNRNEAWNVAFKRVFEDPFIRRFEKLPELWPDH